FPQDVRTLYFGAWFKNAADHTHPPVGEYHLALIYRLVGKFSETSFRLLFATPYAVMAVLGFYGLAARFTSNAFWVTLVFALSPPFFVMAPTMMMDVPCVGALLLGFRFMIARRQPLPGGFAQRNGNGTQKAQIRAQKAQKIRSMRSFLCFLCPLCASCVPFLFPLGKALPGW